MHQYRNAREEGSRHVRADCDIPIISRRGEEDQRSVIAFRQCIASPNKEQD